MVNNYSHKSQLYQDILIRFFSFLSIVIISRSLEGVNELCIILELQSLKHIWEFL